MTDSMTDEVRSGVPSADTTSHPFSNAIAALSLTLGGTSAHLNAPVEVPIWRSIANLNVELTDPLSLATTQQVPDIARTFRHLVQWWKADTTIATLSQSFRHPAYQAIISLGWPVVPYLLTEMGRNPNHWFVALNAITGEDPSPENATFDMAVSSWLTWGRDRGII